MRATLDSYLQMRVELTPEDVKLLEERGHVEGETWRPLTGQNEPLRLYYIPERIMLPEKLPKGFKGHEIYIGPSQLRLIKEREITGEGFERPPGKWLRSVEISLENALE
ncbi:MAG TPA: hypothetical protein VI612_02515 [Candidatus Nanoarchaeia archaeon]|nr:hypothetical protein [Candidatus Nanoarchaeia archaeon]